MQRSLSMEYHVVQSRYIIEIMIDTMKVLYSYQMHKHTPKSEIAKHDHEKMPTKTVSSFFPRQCQNTAMPYP